MAIVDYSSFRWPPETLRYPSAPEFGGRTGDGNAQVGTHCHPGMAAYFKQSSHVRLLDLMERRTGREVTSFENGRSSSSIAGPKLSSRFGISFFYFLC